jgi:hypothetical protein
LETYFIKYYLMLIPMNFNIKSIHFKLLFKNKFQRKKLVLINPFQVWLFWFSIQKFHCLKQMILVKREFYFSN